MLMKLQFERVTNTVLYHSVLSQSESGSLSWQCFQNQIINFLDAKPSLAVSREGKHSCCSHQDLQKQILLKILTQIQRNHSLIDGYFILCMTVISRTACQQDKYPIKQATKQCRNHNNSKAFFLFCHYCQACLLPWFTPT